MHPIYAARSPAVHEIHRIAWTRLHLSAHTLAIEEGRWNRRGRLPVEERLCPCGAVQDEVHVVQHCPATEHLRLAYGFQTVAELYDKSVSEMCEVSFKIISTYRG